MSHTDTPTSERPERLRQPGLESDPRAPSALTKRRDGRDQPAPATYYGLASIKPSPWTDKVPVYVALAGLGGAAQGIAWLARHGGNERHRSIVRHGRFLGLATAVLGAPLLIADLKTPKRFANMLRIFRPTSPMSIGSYVLTTFGLMSALTVAAEVAPRGRGRRGRFGRRLARIGEAAQLPAALTGAGLATYTGALLAATSVPLWAARPGLLTARFAASSVASGAAALSLAEHAGGDPCHNSRKLDAIAFLATAAGAVLKQVMSASTPRERLIMAPVEDASLPAVLAKVGASGVGQMLPLALLALNMASRRPSVPQSALASAAIIAGSFALRLAIMRGEKTSAASGAAYLRFTEGNGPSGKPNGGVP